MPAFKYRQKNSLIVLERGHKAHGYVQTADGFLLGNKPSRPGLHSAAAPRLLNLAVAAFDDGSVVFARSEVTRSLRQTGFDFFVRVLSSEDP